jgi:hypothetical protein
VFITADIGDAVSRRVLIACHSRMHAAIDGQLKALGTLQSKGILMNRLRNAVYYGCPPRRLFNLWSFFVAPLFGEGAKNSESEEGTATARQGSSF